MDMHAIGEEQPLQNVGETMMNLHWSETAERQLLGNDLITETEEMCKVIRENLKTAQLRQKSYYDSKHHDLAFEI